MAEQRACDLSRNMEHFMMMQIAVKSIYEIVAKIDSSLLKRIEIKLYKKSPV